MSIIFLSYSRADLSSVRELYNKLRHKGFQVWFDEENILPGQLWEIEIKKAIENATLVIALLSENSVSRTGYVQKEIRTALEFMERMPEGKPYLIPLRLDNCQIPSQLSHIHCGQLISDQDFEKLIKALYGYMGTPLSPAVIPTNYARYQHQFATDHSLIIPGYGASMIRVGATSQEVRLTLGEPQKEAVFDDYYYLNYYSRGVSVRADKGKDLVTTVFLYREGVDSFRGYVGSTPEGISPSSSRRDVEGVFGRPSVVGGKGTINYWVLYKQGIGITYNTLDPEDLNAAIRHIGIFEPST